jgi:hypothetical protein
LSLVIPKWRAVKVARWEDLLVHTPSGGRELSAATIAILNYMPIIGITELTEVNAMDALCRITMIECLCGPLTISQDESGSTHCHFVTKDDITRHIGMQTEGVSRSHAEFFELMSRSVSFASIDVGVTSAYIANGRMSLVDAVKLTATAQ